MFASSPLRLFLTFVYFVSFVVLIFVTSAFLRVLRASVVLLPSSNKSPSPHLPIPQVSQFVFIEPVIMGQLVQNGNADLPSQPFEANASEPVSCRGEDSFSIDGHDIGQRTGMQDAFVADRDACVQAAQRIASPNPGFAHHISRRVVLYVQRDFVNQLMHQRGQFGQDLFQDLVETISRTRIQRGNSSHQTVRCKQRGSAYRLILKVALRPSIHTSPITQPPQPGRLQRRSAGNPPFQAVDS